MIEITVSESCNSKGEPRDHYSLRDTPSVSITGGSNALNKICRKLVAMGLSGPAQVSGENGKVRFLIMDVVKLAATDLRESDDRGFYVEPYREFAGVLRVAV